MAASHGNKENCGMNLTESTPMSGVASYANQANNCSRSRKRKGSLSSGSPMNDCSNAEFGFGQFRDAKTRSNSSQDGFDDLQCEESLDDCFSSNAGPWSPSINPPTKKFKNNPSSSISSSRSSSQSSSSSSSQSHDSMQMDMDMSSSPLGMMSPANTTLGESDISTDLNDSDLMDTSMSTIDNDDDSTIMNRNRSCSSSTSSSPLATTNSQSETPSPAAMVSSSSSSSPSSPSSSSSSHFTAHDIEQAILYSGPEADKYVYGPDCTILESKDPSLYGSVELLTSLQRILELDNDTEMASWMHQREKDYQPDCNYMEKQQHIVANMRSILFDWMMEVSQEFSLGREALYLAANYVDRFVDKITTLTIQRDARRAREEREGRAPNLKTMSPEHRHMYQHMVEYDGSQFPIVTRANLQLLGVTCLFVASKLEEIYPPNAKDFAITTDGAYSTLQIDMMERQVLQLLKWELHPQTPYSWLKLFVKRAAHRIAQRANQYFVDNKDRIKTDPAAQEEMRVVKRQHEDLLRTVLSVKRFVRCMELLDMALLDLYFLRFLPSALASSVMYVVVPELRPLFTPITGYDAQSLRPCTSFLSHFAMHLQPLGIRCQEKPYFDLNIPAEDMYTRQMHHGEARALLTRLVTEFHNKNNISNNSNSNSRDCNNNTNTDDITNDSNDNNNSCNNTHHSHSDAKQLSA